MRQNLISRKERRDMKRVLGTTIYLTRGDTLHLQVGMMIGNEAYELQEGDVVRFAMKKEYEDDEPLILKNLEDGWLNLVPGDTKELEFGDYVYDIQLTTAEGEVDTFIHEAKFSLLKEVD